jgi:ribosome production factor 1
VVERRKAKRQARDQRKKEAERLGLDAPPKKVPRTLESTREPDETMVDPADEEVQRDIAADEFAAYFSGASEPRVAITTSVGASKAVLAFAGLLARIFHNAECFFRRTYTLEEVVRFCCSRGYTDLVVLNDNRSTVTDILLSHLPAGPTAHFTVMGVVMPARIPGHGKMTSHPCELILNNFATRLGISVGRMLACLFPQQPDFRGRRVATFHCQRDFIFFRQHRYIFEESETAMERKSGPVVTRIQELGPRFTMKLHSLRLGAADDIHGEYIFVRKKDVITSRRRFFL